MSFPCSTCFYGSHIHSGNENINTLTHKNSAHAQDTGTCSWHPTAKINETHAYMSTTSLISKSFLQVNNNRKLLITSKLSKPSKLQEHITRKKNLRLKMMWQMMVMVTPLVMDIAVKAMSVITSIIIAFFSLLHSSCYALYKLRPTPLRRMPSSVVIIVCHYLKSQTLMNTFMVLG
jgi:hypothetical protein